MINLNWTDKSFYIKVALFIVLTLNLLSISIFREQQAFGDYLLDATLYITTSLFIIYLLLLKTNWKEYKWVNYTFIAFILYYLISHLIKDYSYSIVDFFYFFSVCIFVLAMTHIKWDQKALNLISHIVALFIIFTFIHWINTDMITHKFEGVMLNPNVTGILYLGMVYYSFLGLYTNSIIQKLYFTPIILMNMVLIYATTSRAVFWGLMVMIISWIILKISKKFFYYLFPLTLLGNLAIVSFYTFLSDSKFSRSLNNWSKDSFNKSFYSGREDIWSEAVPHAMEAPLLGYHVNIVPNDYLSFQGMIHVHNQFLQILLESGLIGLGIFIGILSVFWHHYNKAIHLYPVQLSACFLIGIIAHQNFGLTLFLHLQSIGLILWLAIAIGVSVSIQAQKARK